MALVEARTRLAEEQAALRRLERLKRQGRLCDAAEVERVSFEFWRGQRDSWLNWPQRIAAELAAELGVDALVLATALERLVHAHLMELADRPPWLSGAEAAEYAAEFAGDPFSPHGGEDGDDA